MIKNFLKRFSHSHRENMSSSTATHQICEGAYSEIASEEDIEACFRLLLGRKPLPKEWYGHKKEAGQKLIEIVSKFLSSHEFKSRKLSSPRLADSQHDIVELDEFKLCLSRTDKVCGPLLETKEYEPHVTAILKKVLAPGMVFLDIGANVGYFSCLAASIVGDNGCVLSFEPETYNIS